MTKGIYKFFVKLVGAGISATILFLPVNLDYNNNTVFCSTKLKDPITKEIFQLLEAGFKFRIKYYSVIIINDNKTYTQSITRCLKYDKNWKINNKEIKRENIQENMGKIDLAFKNIVLHEGDEIFFFIKAIILPDTMFSRDVGMSTRILWNHYVPRINAYYKFHNDKLIRK